MGFEEFVYLPVCLLELFATVQQTSADLPMYHIKTTYVQAYVHDCPNNIPEFRHHIVENSGQCHAQSSRVHGH